MKKADALAALDIWGCEVEVAGWTVTVPALPAAEWMMAILREDAGPIIPGMLADPIDRAKIIMALIDGETTIEELAELSRDVLAEMSGWHWWQADRLIRGAGAYWRQIGGQLGRLGVDLHAISIAAALNTIYVLCVETMTQEERAKFEFELSRPPEGVDAAELYDAEAATAAVYALLGPPPVPPAPAPEVIDAPLD